MDIYAPSAHEILARQFWEDTKKELKRELLLLVKENKIETKHYVIDELLKAHGHLVMCLPPYHCDLNPIEFCWAQVKQYYKKILADVTNTMR